MIVLHFSLVESLSRENYRIMGEHHKQGRNQDFAKRGAWFDAKEGGLENGIFCNIILMM